FTLSTSHFLIHFPSGYEELAQHVARGAERAHDRLAQRLGWAPLQLIHVVLVPKSDRPENMAFVFPHSQIFLDAAIADYSLAMEEFTDWYETIFTHELAHIFQMSYEDGLYRWLSPIFGSWLKPNRFAPCWMTEGLAVALETEL